MPPRRQRKIKAKDTIDFVYEANLEKLIIQQGIHNTAKIKFTPAIANMVNSLTGKKSKCRKSSRGLRNESPKRSLY